MHRLVVILALALLASATLHLRAAPAARNAEFDVLDRTFTCSTALIGGIHQAKIRARRGSGRRTGTWSQPALVGLSTSVNASADRAIYNEIAWVSAGRPAKTSPVIDVYYPGIEFPMRSWGTIGVNAGQCRPSSARVALERGGLVSRDVGPLNDSYECASGKVLVRVRATLSTASSLTSFRGFVRTTTPVKAATLVARTRAGKALVYSEVADTGKTRLFVASNCYPD